MSPTSAEAGFPTVLIRELVWRAGAEGDAQARLSTLLTSAIAAGLAEPKIEESFSKLGVYIVKDGTPESFGAFLAPNSTSGAALAKDVGARVD